MPDAKDYNSEEEWMGACVPMMIAEGSDHDQAVAACMNMWGEKAAAKYMGKFIAVKAVGDWELDVLAAPFGTDSDGQTFDSNTDFMLGDFSQPAIIYHHGVMPGKKALQQKPVIIGKTTAITQQPDGIHLRVQLDKALEWARRVWEAAKKGMAVASSDSISHLARLNVGGKLIMYEKDRPGHIAVWPLAGVSLWDKVPGNFNPASRYALALPAMKAIYRDAGLAFPDNLETHGDLPYADSTAAKRAEEKKIIQQRARDYLAKHPEK
jgi:hypothetical protein